MTSSFYFFLSFYIPDASSEVCHIKEKPNGEIMLFTDVKLSYPNRMNLKKKKSQAESKSRPQ